PPAARPERYVRGGTARPPAGAPAGAPGPLGQLPRADGSAECGHRAEEGSCPSRKFRRGALFVSAPSIRAGYPDGVASHSPGLPPTRRPPAGSPEGVAPKTPGSPLPRASLGQGTKKKTPPPPFS